MIERSKLPIQINSATQSLNVA